MPDVPTPDNPRICPNCQTEAIGRYCSKCAQDQTVSRLTFRVTLARLAKNVLDFESPMLRTIRDLTLRPGATAARYVRGQRAGLVNPFKYCFIMAALTTITVQVFGVEMLPEEVRVTIAQGQPSEREIMQQRMNEFIVEWLGVINLVMLPILASLHRLFFWEWRLNVAEWYAAMLFFYGHIMLLSWPFLILGLREGMLGMVLSTAAPFVLVPYAVCGLLRSRSPSIVLRVFAATVIYFFSFALFGGIVGASMIFIEELGG